MLPPDKSPETQHFTLNSFSSERYQNRTTASRTLESLISRSSIDLNINLQINLIFIWYSEKWFFCGKRTANQKPRNFAFYQWENREIQNSKLPTVNIEIKQPGFWVFSTKFQAQFIGNKNCVQWQAIISIQYR